MKALKSLLIYYSILYYNIMKKSEYVETNEIPNILKLKLKSYEILHKYNETHYIIKIQISDFLNSNIKNWKYNRPPDLIRCVDIAKYIFFSKKPVDSMFYLFFNNINETFEIIDGIHRYNALKYIKQENSKSIDFITPGDFGNNNDAFWFYQQFVILNIRFNSLEEELIGAFKNLNKSNPVPDLYFRDEVKERREVIENIVKKWQIKYKPHFSSSIKPNVPNINRDRFVDLLDKLYDKYDIKLESQYVLEDALENMNEYIKNNIPKKLSEIIIKKCNETGCYLFLFKLDKLEELEEL
jgi:hypothetical protein